MIISWMSSWQSLSFDWVCKSLVQYLYWENDDLMTDCWWVERVIHSWNCNKILARKQNALTWTVRFSWGFHSSLNSLRKALPVCLSHGEWAVRQLFQTSCNATLRQTYSSDFLSTLNCPSNILLYDKTCSINCNFQRLINGLLLTLLFHTISSRDHCLDCKSISFSHWSDPSSLLTSWQ